MGLNGWVEELGEMGFTNAVYNEGKWNGVISDEQVPQGLYLKFLHYNNMASVHCYDFRKRKEDNFAIFPTNLQDYAYCDNWLSNNAVKMLKEFDDDKPWFLQVNFTGLNEPWDITKDMKELWRNIEFPQPYNNSHNTPAGLNGIRQNYAAMLENIDRNIAIIIYEIEKQVELHNTIMIYSADHGEMLVDNNLIGKSVPYRGSRSVPLVFCGKGIQKGIYNNHLVEMQDIASTIS